MRLPSLLQTVLEPAFIARSDSTLRPRLVSRATYTTTPPFTLTFRIRPEARWSDGVPVTARDFLFTHEAMAEHLASEDQGVHGLVRSAVAVDAKTVRVVMRSRTARWRELFPRVLPSHALRGQDLERIWSDGIENPRTGAPIGSGPFLLQSWERGERMTFVRNPRYWGAHTAYLDRIVIRFCRSCSLVRPDQVLEAIRQGEVDIAGTRDPVVVSDIRSIPGWRVLTGRLIGLDHLALRLGPGGHPALADKLVRRALTYGIDRVEVARTVLGEFDPSYPATDSAIFVNTDRHYLPTGRRTAIAPLRRAASSSRRAAGVEPMASTCAQANDSRSASSRSRAATFRIRALELIQRQLRQAGVEVVLAFAPPAVLFGSIFDSGAFDGVEYALFSIDGLGADVHGCGGAFNITGYCQRLVTRDLDQSDRILDATRRGSVLNRADVQIAKDVPMIPLFQTPNFVAYRANIRNVVSAAGHELWNAENWWLAEPH